MTMRDLNYSELIKEHQQDNSEILKRLAELGKICETQRLANGGVSAITNNQLAEFRELKSRIDMNDTIIAHCEKCIANNW